MHVTAIPPSVTGARIVRSRVTVITATLQRFKGSDSILALGGKAPLPGTGIFRGLFFFFGEAKGVAVTRQC